MAVGNVEGTVETPPLDLFTSREKSHIHKIDRQREVFSPLRAGYTTATKVYDWSKRLCIKFINA